MSKTQQPALFVEDGKQGMVGVLRTLHQIQLSVPDKLFFISKYRSKSQKKKSKEKTGLFSGVSFRGGKKESKANIDKAVENVKYFYNSFQIKREARSVTKKQDAAVMSVSAMNDFRSEVKAAASEKDAGFRWIALEAIVKFIDLKNSGIVKDKALIQQDCLRKVGEALHADGGLSMFHATWFLTMYRDYLAGFRMFRPGEVESLNRDSNREAQNILKKLQRKQFEIPVYLRMVNEEAIDAKLLLRYSKEDHVKSSRHGKKGCTRQEIKKLFNDTFKGGDSSSSTLGGKNEVNIVMSYAMLFARIPMLYEAVEAIKSSIPTNTTESKLYRQKISIAQKVALLEIASSLHHTDGSEENRKKLFQLGRSIFDFCSDVISEHRLGSVTMTSSIFTYPIMKQAALLISYRRIFQTKKEQYADMLLHSIKLMKTVKQCSRSGDRALIRIASYADTYEQKLEITEYEIRKSIEKESGKKPNK